MFENIAESRSDPLLQLIADYAADTRPDKIDLGVGVFKDENGQTPVLASVKAAEQRLVQDQESKSYVGMLGDLSFGRAVSELVLGSDPASGRLTSLQTPGGCGALRLLFETVKLARPDAIVWLPSPGWANHPAIVDGVGLKFETYPYYDPTTSNLRFDDMREHLQGLSINDVVLLHGCCHNPTGANLTPEQWDEVAELAVERGFLPFVDLAYQGFGTGLDADAYGARRLATRVPELLIAYSCSKNFAIYRDRTGAALTLSAGTDNAKRILAQMTRIARADYSMPPDHGAAVVSTILHDESLRAQWMQELEAMQQRLSGIRAGVSAAFRQRLGNDHFDFVATQEGMFSLLGLAPEQVARLRDEHAIYMAGDSRINIAGLSEAQIPVFVEAAANVL
ncbi:MAG: aspartate/tyrosine/aromatic aminotransferase [Gammaproteobacteria bacterium]|nr:aspartate/tyrosine/aromatic aminotransferase [Gammaproteobacteria bacterium]